MKKMNTKMRILIMTNRKINEFQNKFNLHITKKNNEKILLQSKPLRGGYQYNDDKTSNINKTKITIMM